jgi:voltage-gated potassium channel Kch
VETSSHSLENGCFVVIGDTTIARRVCASLQARGRELVHLVAPGDDDLRQVMREQPAGVAVLVDGDLAALRYALATAHIAPAVPLMVSIFDHTVSDQLVRLLPHCEVTSPGDLVAPALAGACLDRETVAVHRTADGAVALRQAEGDLTPVPWRLSTRARWRARFGRLAGQFRPHDSGTRILFAGLVGIVVVLLGDWVWLVTGLGHPPVEALHEAVRVVTTVGPASTSPAHETYVVVSAVAMLATLIFAAMFTAGLVDRLLGPRLVGVVGPRTLPQAGHVIVVGLGQVGLRLCQELLRLGIPVVGVERNPSAPHLRIARTLGIPVVVGHGGDRVLLERLRLGRAMALAAVGSDDLDNIAVAVAAHGVAAGTHVVLRAGEHEAIAETRSLLPLGVTRDVTSISAAYVVARLLGVPATTAVPHAHDIYVEVDGQGFRSWPVSPRDQCVVSGDRGAPANGWTPTARHGMVNTWQPRRTCGVTACPYRESPND